MEKRPDLFWFRTFDLDFNKTNKSNRYVHAEKISVSSNMGKFTNNLGNMLKVVKVYDIYFLYNQYWETIFFAKKKLREDIKHILTSKNYFNQASRELDMNKVEFIYNRQ